MGVNHMGHALLTKLLTPLLLETSSNLSPLEVRVIVLSSEGHKYVPKGGIQFETLKSKAEGIATAWRYGQSKLANVLLLGQ
jgi:NAD(P)-dependent dehydrogenase (short-subunit alcohol dehydrogenase family)